MKGTYQGALTVKRGNFAQESNLSLILINLDVSFKDQPLTFCKIVYATEFRLNQKTNPEKKQKLTNAKFTCNFWRKIFFKVREMS